MARDPVCGMPVDEQQATAQGLSSEYQGERFFFCSPGCKQQFDRSPERYVGPAAAER